MRNICNLFKYNHILYNHFGKKIPTTCISPLNHVRPFFEYNKRGFDYPVFPSDKKPVIQHIRDGAKIFVGECKLFLEETKEHFCNDPKIYADGDTEVVFRFDSKDCLRKWRVGSDKIHKEGFSECEFFINDKHKGVFHGTIDTTPPKDGKHRFAGYCAIKSVRKTKSFLRDDWYDWSAFTHVEIRVKGDGRNYMLNLSMGMYFDVSWFDMYSYVLHTRGGPYWQLVRIPFSKFFLTYKGRTQDQQDPMPRNRVDCIGITAAAVPGPFHLEIDYIGVYKDDSHTEKTAYEMYQLPVEMVTA